VVPCDIGFDLAVSYEDRAGVVYRDRLGSRYGAQPLAALPSGAASVSARDFDTTTGPISPSGGLRSVPRF